MRLIPLLLLALYIALDVVAVASDITLDRRQDTEAVTTSSTDTASTEPPASTTQAISMLTSGSATSTSSSTETGVRISASALNNTAPATTARQTATSSGRKGDVQEPDHLPLQPKTTPALGVAGVFLITLGGVYSLIGIKNQWVHVFLSAAFLAGLGVTVLIVYVMNPPVRNAIQGAYFVAAFLTGLIFGALCLVFKEITEGLGCILGGFCLSMWMLTLKSGGLFNVAGAKGAFIGAFSAGAYALFFTRYTRPYALMASTAFSGSTAVVLGIDCFSRAGLKEFWLYIWDLNEDIFPLNTTTYPLTRGIRVESAVIVIICFFGVLSQLKLWKVIEQRRKKQVELEKEENEKREEDEAELARKLEEGNMRERTQWEAMYGNRDVQQSESGNEAEVPDDPKKNSTTVEIAEIKQSDETWSKYSSGPAERRPSQCDGEDQMDERDSVASRMRKDPECTYDTGTHEQPEDFPQAVAPPIEIPDAAISLKDDGGSVAATFATSEPLSPRRSSGHSLSKRLSLKNSAHISSQSEEALISTHSPASSVTGEMGEVREMQPERQGFAWKNDYNSEGPTTITPTEGENSDSHLPKESLSDSSEEMTEEDAPAQGESKASLSANTKVPKLSVKTGQKESSSPSAADLLPAGEILSLLPVTSPPTRSPEETESVSPYDSVSRYSRDTKESFSKERSEGTTGRRAALTAEAVQTLPDHESRIVTSYRTSEWTKHLSEADAPEPDPIEPDNEDPGDGGNPLAEVAAPVNVEELQQTALNAQPPPFVNRRTSAADKPSTQMHKQSVSDVSALPAGESPKLHPTVKKSCKRLSQMSAGSRNNLPHSPSASPQIGSSSGGLRGMSTPLLSKSSAAAPIRESKEADFPEQTRPASQSLIALRESMIRNRMSAMSLHRDSWIDRSNSKVSLNEANNWRLQASQWNLVDGDDIPLAQRRTFLQPRNLNRRSSSGVFPTTAPFYSHQSLQQQQSATSIAKRNEAAIAAWRDAIREDTSFPPPSTTNFYRSGMREERRQSWQEKRQQTVSASYIDGAIIAGGMQRGDLHEAHREAMRRMQAAANRHV